MTAPTVIVVNEDAACPHCGTNQSAILAALARIEQQLGEIMSEDAAVLAVVTDENTQITNLTASVGSLQGLVESLQAEVAAGTALQPSTLAALQSAQAALDTLAASTAADVTGDTPAAPAS